MAEAVRGVKGGREGGPLVMRTEDLKVWLQETMRKKEPVKRRWELLVILVHQTFEDMNPPEDPAWATMVLIPKGKGEFWVIGLVEVAWKVYAAVVNFWLNLGVVLHDALHRFRTGQRLGTATLEANLNQQLAGLAHKPIFQVFLDMRKAYNSLDRG